jgi:hypothetical protein
MPLDAADQTAADATPDIFRGAGLTVPRDRLYRLGRGLVGHPERAGLDGRAQRLLHALMHATCRDVGDWASAVGCRPDEPHRRSCLELRRVMGTQGANGNGAIHDAMAQLYGTSLFDVLGYTSTRREWVVWQFAEETFDLLMGGEQYGYLDVAHLHGARSHLSIWLTESLALARAKRLPRFEIAPAWIGTLDGGDPIGWRDARPRLLRACRRQAALWDARLALICHEEGRTSGIDRVELRMAHAGRQWGPKDAARTGPRARKVILISPDGGVDDYCRSDAAPALRAHLGR